MYPDIDLLLFRDVTTDIKKRNCPVLPQCYLRQDEHQICQRSPGLTASTILAYVKQTRLAGADNGPAFVKVLGRLRKGRRCLFKVAGTK